MELTELQKETWGNWSRGKREYEGFLHFRGSRQSFQKALISLGITRLSDPVISCDGIVSSPKQAD